ncbi:ribonuclease H [Senna tora]|uniref:Ribonuclease H n=1 Tax=Senna tora TaxID=362788 RepID=A0A834SZ51_9FABA|nr:ribonuclease H [Senna tora]
MIDPTAEGEAVNEEVNAKVSPHHSLEMLMCHEDPNTFLQCGITIYKSLKFEVIFKIILQRTNTLKTLKTYLLLVAAKEDGVSHKSSCQKWWYFLLLGQRINVATFWRHSLELVYDKSKFMNKPWIAIGDFNQIRYHHNKISKSNRVDGAGVFNQMIQICDFTDLNPTGTWCTWTNGRGSEVWARLDRTLCSDDWLQSYPCSYFLLSACCSFSSQSPYCRQFGVKPFCKRPFRFENLWLMFDKCNVVVNQSWETDVNSSPSVILHEKFNFLRGNLRIWNSHEDILGYYKGRCRSPTSFSFRQWNLTDHLNKSFITLIPKTNAPQSFKDFRHISLANVSYKLITKVLCSRLKCFLPDLIAPNQSAFLKGRLITDNIVLATELMHKIRMVKQANNHNCQAVKRVLDYYGTLAGLRMNVQKKIECLMANFFWGHNGNRPKIHLQKWQDLNIPKDEGGLVLCNISAFNEALLAKHIWRLIDHNNSLVDITLAPKFRDSDGNFVARSNSPGDGILSLKLKI